MLSQNLFTKYLARFDELIVEGEAMLQRIKVIPSEYSYTVGSAYTLEPPQEASERYEFDEADDFQKWLTNYKLLLDQVIPPTSSQRGLIDKPGYSWNQKMKLENYLSVLKSVRENYEKGLLEVSQSALSSFNTEDVYKLLRRVSAGLRRWTWEKRPRTKRGEARQWHIDNEYHVQNQLYFLLAPLFPDIREEEYTRSVGQKKPRVDLEIPSLKLVIEIKFWYPQDTPQKIIGEIAEDTSLYLAEGSPHEQIIAFVWDDFRRTEEHDLLVTGLKTLNGIFDVVIVPRPSFMPESTATGNEGNDG